MESTLTLAENVNVVLPTAQYNATFLLERSVVLMRENVSACNGLKFIVKEFLNDPTSSISVYKKIYNSKPLPIR